MWEHVDRAYSHGREFLNDDTGQAMVGHAMDRGADGFFDSADGTFDFRNMVIGGTDGEADIGKKRFESVVFAIGMNVSWCEAALSVCVKV